jgi:hypothetical protein
LGPISYFTLGVIYSLGGSQTQILLPGLLPIFRAHWGILGFRGVKNFGEFEFGSLPKRTNAPRVKFDFGPIKMVVVGFGVPQKWATAPGVKFEFGNLPKRTNASRVKFVFGSLPKRTNAPRIKFDFGPRKMVVVGVGGPQNGRKPPE